MTINTIGCCKKNELESQTKASLIVIHNLNGELYGA